MICTPTDCCSGRKWSHGSHATSTSIVFVHRSFRTVSSTFPNTLACVIAFLASLTGSCNRAQPAFKLCSVRPPKGNTPEPHPQTQFPLSIHFFLTHKWPCDRSVLLLLFFLWGRFKVLTWNLLFKEEKKQMYFSGGGGRNWPVNSFTA